MKYFIPLIIKIFSTQGRLFKQYYAQLSSLTLVIIFSKAERPWVWYCYYTAVLQTVVWASTTVIKKKTMINLIEVLQRKWTNCDSKNNRCRHQIWCWNENTALPSNFQWESMRPSCSYRRQWQSKTQTFSVTGSRLNFMVATVRVMLRLSITCLAMPHNCHTTMPAFDTAPASV